MSKQDVKTFATRARRLLLDQVKQRALLFGIEDGVAADPTATAVGTRVLSAVEVQQRTALIQRISNSSYQQVMEEVAYTWFNRFCALRFMEVNEYLPSYVRLFTDAADDFHPQILKEALNLDYGADTATRQWVAEAIRTAVPEEQIYKRLLIWQCNDLNAYLPVMFERIADDTELLFPDHLLREGSVLHQMVTTIPTEDWRDAVQIIGWLYQFYNSEKKDEVFAALKKNVKISKENIPAATQIFTPDWIVRYMVENSLGRLWVEGHPNEELKKSWRYYLEEAEQEPEVQAQLADIRKEYAAMQPEDIKCIDPCMGSGHILAYMFDVLVQIYESCGYTTRDAVRYIVEKNLYGLDIDDRAAQLAYFAVMMKARQYDRRFLTRKDDDDKPDVPQPKVYAICESNSIDNQALEYFANGDTRMYFALQTIVHELHDAKEYGSLLKCSSLDFSTLHARATVIRQSNDLHGDSVLKELLPLLRVAEILSMRYDAVVTNPPYMGASGMSPKLSTFIKEQYPNTKSDLFAACMEQFMSMTAQGGLSSMVTMQSWMFLSSFEKFRNEVINMHRIVSLLHMENMVMGIAFGTAAAVFGNTLLPNYVGTYNQITMRDISNETPREFPSCQSRFAQISSSSFTKIPGSPIAYWVSEKLRDIFKNNPPIGNVAEAKVGLQTSDNNRFLRLWYEVSYPRIGFGMLNREEAYHSGLKWFPYNKGGVFRKWYGNQDYVVNWEQDGHEICNFRDVKGKLLSRPQNTQYYFRESISWSDITSSVNAFRYYPTGYIHDVVGMSVFGGDSNWKYSCLIYSNLRYTQNMVKILNPTMHFNTGYFEILPFAQKAWNKENEQSAKRLIELAKIDWDSSEVSWDYTTFPLLKHECKRSYIEESYAVWRKIGQTMIEETQTLEIGNNKRFNAAYGIEEEIGSDVPFDEITLSCNPDYRYRRTELSEDEKEKLLLTDTMKEMISYAVGCMFGRYSLDVEGLAYAGGEWDESKYKTFPADKDNIIPICDDEYFEDDIVGRFEEFIRVAYGADTLEENLRYIADALDGKGSAREVIRKYFRDDFYADHLKIYQKRPIYWQFDSGRKGGFRALMYIHRYDKDTLGRLRTNYVHRQQDRYRTAINHLEMELAELQGGAKVRKNAELTKRRAQLAETIPYEELLQHYAEQQPEMDLDNGVKQNYANLFPRLLRPIK